MSHLQRDSSGKNGQLSGCKCVFHQTEANLAEIQPQNHQNVKKAQLWQKIPGVNGLNSMAKSSSMCVMIKGLT